MHGLGKRFEAGLQILAEMDAEGAAAAFSEDIEVTASLRGLYGAERVFLIGHGEVGSIVAGDLEKYAAVGATFVSLSCGMQKSRAETEARGEFLFVTNDVTEFLKDFFIFGVHGDVAEDGEVIARASAGEMFFQYVDKF